MVMYRYKEICLKFFFFVFTMLFLLLITGPSYSSSKERTYVPEDVAFEHAAVALVQHVLIPTPSLLEDKQPEYGWEGARIGTPSLVYDINSHPLLHIFPVVTEDNIISGSIWVAADMMLGTTVVAIHENKEFPNFEAVMERVHRKANLKYPGWKVQKITPVVYSYPRLGIKLTLSEPETANSADLVYDLYDLSEAPIITSSMEKMSDPDIGRNASWSFLNDIPTNEREKRIQQWEAKHEWDRQVREVLSVSDGFPRALRSAPLKLVLDLKDVIRKVYAQSQCEIYTTRHSWQNYCQSGVPYCAAAVGRNIAGYYGVSQLETKVAQLMGITDTDWPTVQGELNYYKSPNGLNKTGTVSFTTATNPGKAHLGDWKSFKSELQKDKDFLIPSSIGLGKGWGAQGPGGWQQPGHWNALYSIKVCKSPKGDENVLFGIFDPYPPSICGGYSFESFNYLKGQIRSHTIPKDPGTPPKYPPKPAFEPWKCKQFWYKMLYPASCKKFEDMIKRVQRAQWEKP